MPPIAALWSFLIDPTFEGGSERACMGLRGVSRHDGRRENLASLKRDSVPSWKPTTKKAYEERARYSSPWNSANTAGDCAPPS